MDRLDAMQTFVRVIEKGNFSAVAKERGIGQPAVSKQISALEEELGTELIHRTSRSIALTEPGRDFYESAFAFWMILKTRLLESAGARQPRKGLSVWPFLPHLRAFIWCRSCL